MDVLFGGTGADVFYYAAGDGNDQILDFSAAEGHLVEPQGVSYVSGSGSGNVANVSDASVLTRRARTGGAPTTSFKCDVPSCHA